MSCVTPGGALYVFPRLDPDVYPIKDDQRFALELLREKHVLIVQGTGFNRTIEGFSQHSVEAGGITVPLHLEVSALAYAKHP